ncbi:MAG: prephenate dehydrogenase/arogenate dehydrogenase family protein [Lentisphaerae bacterium]|nr:prephenate dehydrogenase/arogenate dehydrogenase family protein [Lentisphaerota bacterium]
MKPFERLAIIGLGLMGGSLGLAAKQRRVARRVVGYARRAETRAEALRLGMVDEACAQAAEAVRGADMVVLCVPVLSMPDVARDCRGAFGDGAVVTDVGSTKAELGQAVEAVLAGTGAIFVGSHPIAGSDETGLDAARVDLYEKAVVVVTPAGGARAPGVEAVRVLWEGVGALVELMTPEAHDEVVARTSHLPHLVASALVRTVLGQEADRVARFCGSGFRDTTRVAGGSEAIWHDIVKTNRGAVRAELGAFAAELERLRALLADDNFDGIREYLAQARARRRALPKGK